jgi:hypothetical protein
MEKETEGEVCVCVSECVCEWVCVWEREMRDNVYPFASPAVFLDAWIDKQSSWISLKVQTFAIKTNYVSARQIKVLNIRLSRTEIGL